MRAPSKAIKTSVRYLLKRRPVADSRTPCSSRVSGSGLTIWMSAGPKLAISSIWLGCACAMLLRIAVPYIRLCFIVS